MNHERCARVAVAGVLASRHGITGAHVCIRIEQVLQARRANDVLARAHRLHSQVNVVGHVRIGQATHQRTDASPAGRVQLQAAHDRVITRIIKQAYVVSVLVAQDRPIKHQNGQVVLQSQIVVVRGSVNLDDAALVHAAHGYSRLVGEPEIDSNHRLESGKLAVQRHLGRIEVHAVASRENVSVRDEGTGAVVDQSEFAVRLAPIHLRDVDQPREHVALAELLAADDAQTAPAERLRGSSDAATSSR